MYSIFARGLLGVSRRQDLIGASPVFSRVGTPSPDLHEAVWREQMPGVRAGVKSQRPSQTSNPLPPCRREEGKRDKAPYESQTEQGMAPRARGKDLALYTAVQQAFALASASPRREFQKNGWEELDVKLNASPSLAFQHTVS
ncbi:hypothetical protein JHW43_007360 [Diplocarpon mali]|nr:hypothetical protein JHW43_007360 [Diplocarpon mali]